jgi:hypothetical protein
MSRLYCMPEPVIAQEAFDAISGTLFVRVHVLLLMLHTGRDEGCDVITSPTKEGGQEVESGGDMIPLHHPLTRSGPLISRRQVLL